MAGSNNENDINEITNFNESAVMSSFEVHSTPNVGQDDKTMNVSGTNETDSTEDSGVQLTPTSTKCNSKFDNEMMSKMCIRDRYGIRPVFDCGIEC